MIIKEIDLFKGIDLEVLNKIADICSEENYTKDTVLFNKGDDAERLYILEEGTVKLIIQNGGTISNSLTEPGDIFGWSCMAEFGRYTSSGICATDVKAMMIERNKLNNIFDLHPDIGLKIVRRFAGVFSKRISNYDRETVINKLLRYSLEDMPIETLLERTLQLILSIPWLALKKQGCIFLVEDDSKMLTMKAQSRLAEPIKKACANLSFGMCHCGRAALTQEIQFVDCLDESHDIRYDGIMPHGHYCVPILYKNETLGVINLYIREGHHRDQREIEFLVAIANTLAGIIRRKRLEQDLVRSERLAATGETVAGLAHCIKNILLPLEGGIYVVEKGFRKNDMEKLQTGWDMVRRNIDKVSNLALDLLTFSKDHEPEYEGFSPNVVVDEVCYLMESWLKNNATANINIIRDFDPGIGDAYLNPKGIHRCLLNLVSNAVDACLYDKDPGKSHHVTVSTRADGNDAVIFQVSDNGCGMDETVKTQLFTNFFSTKGSRGTGLGLLVTQKIIREHGGTLGVESELGQGTTFTIRMPRNSSGEISEA
jgi:signal transduction histidine kinase